MRRFDPRLQPLIPARSGPVNAIARVSDLPPGIRTFTCQESGLAIYTYIKSYRLTQDHLYPLLTGEDVHDRKCDIFLPLCGYIAGPTAGGPWQMRAEDVVEDGRRIVCIREASGRFIAKAQQLYALDADEPHPTWEMRSRCRRANSSRIETGRARRPASRATARRTPAR